MQIKDVGWAKILEDVLHSEKFIALQDFIENERASGLEIFPKNEHIFKAFELSTFDRTKVVILGQDPYHGAGQAQGLAFSVPPGLAFPPSLRNIFKELKNDLGIDVPLFGDLSAWAEQGVLLLNTVLTVREGQPGSHTKKGWELLTDKAIEALSQREKSCVFLLWGAHAHKKISLIHNQQRHLLLCAPHPSPLGAYRGFFGSKPFSQTNNFLISKSQKPIDWQL